MFTGLLSRGIVGLAAVTAPVALACENPDDITYTLRSAPPAHVEPGEFVLELDTNSRLDVIENPTVIPIGGDSLQLSNYFVVFEVTRVLAGDYTERLVRIPYLPTSCSSLSYTSDAYVFVGRWEESAAGARRLMVKATTRRDVRAQLEASQQAAH